MPSKVIFLDRDGTINEDVHFLSKPEQLKLIPGAAEALRRLAEARWRLFVISNQSGVARGLFTESDVAGVHRCLERMLRDEGVIIEGFYYCPHHPEYGPPAYRKDCQCRKPKLGMLYQAAADHGLELKEALVIGDRRSDVFCGLALNGRAVMVRTGYGKKEEPLLLQEKSLARQVVICDDLKEAAGAILAGRIPKPGKPLK